MTWISWLILRGAAYIGIQLIVWVTVILTGIPTGPGPSIWHVGHAYLLTFSLGTVSILLGLAVSLAGSRLPSLAFRATLVVALCCPVALLFALDDKVMHIQLATQLIFALTTPRRVGVGTSRPGPFNTDPLQ